jgi:hypothetical protein
MLLEEIGIAYNLELEEARTADEAMKIRFKFIEADLVNENKRLYPESVLKRAFSEATEKLSKGFSVFGAAQHPKEGRDAEVSDVSHLLTRFWLRGKEGFAEGKILPTRAGRDLHIILRDGGHIGVSARGTGSTKPDEKDKNISIVQEDYKLLSVDFCLSPSFNVFVSKDQIFESYVPDDLRQELVRSQPQDELVVLTARYGFALRAGFKGSFEKFCEQLRKA